MTATPLLNQGNVYGSLMDESFRTPDLHEAEAHAFVYGPKVTAWVRERVVASNRFSNESTIKGAVERHLELLLEFETLRRKGTPDDYFGLNSAT